MSFNSAVEWAFINTFSTNKLSKRKAIWGLYTRNVDDAVAMADFLSTNATHIFEAPHNVGEYPHFHTDNHDFFGYRHFQVWYGLLN